MEELLAERQDASFHRAQAHYDAMEPPEEQECRVCDGQGRVVVASILDVDGKEHPWPPEVHRGEGPEIECPFCGYGKLEHERICRAKEDAMTTERTDS